MYPKYYLIIAIIALFTNVTHAQDCYELVWADEFEGTELDANNWRYHSGGGFWGGQIQYYTFGGTNNYSVSDGTLKLTAVEESYTAINGATYDYTSGAIRTQDLQSWTYGKIEARIKNPTGQGLWPSFWMSPLENLYGTWPHSGEIDIFEILGHQPSKANFALHTSNDPGPEYHADYTIEGTTFADDFHLFAIEWAPEVIRWYIDEELIVEIDRNDLNNNAPWPFDTDFFLRLNVGVGGNWPGNPDATTIFPQTMEVDYVRVYQKTNLVTNSFFDDDMNHWQLNTTGAANGDFQIIDTEKAVISIAQTESSNWKLALRQTGLTLENGAQYQVSLTAWAAENRSISVIVNHQSGTQYIYQGLDLTTEAQHFEFEFTMTEATDINAFLNIGLGADSPTTYLDNIRIIQLPCTPEVSNISINTQSPSAIKIYPNPIRAHKKTKIFTDKVLSEVNLYNIYGNLRFQKKLTKESFQLPKLSPGTYFLWLKTQDGRIQTKTLIVL